MSSNTSKRQVEVQRPSGTALEAQEEPQESELTFSPFSLPVPLNPAAPRGGLLASSYCKDGFGRVQLEQTHLRELFDEGISLKVPPPPP